MFFPTGLHLFHSLKGNIKHRGRDSDWVSCPPSSGWKSVPTGLHGSNSEITQIKAKVSAIFKVLPLSFQSIQMICLRNWGLHRSFSILFIIESASWTELLLCPCQSGDHCHCGMGIFNFLQPFASMAITLSSAGIFFSHPHSNWHTRINPFCCQSVS